MKQILILVMLFAGLANALTLTRNIQGNDPGPTLDVRANDKFLYRIEGEFNALAVLERTDNGGHTWEQVLSVQGPDSGTVVVQEAFVHVTKAYKYRWRLKNYTSGIAVTTLQDSNAPVPAYKEFHNLHGEKVGAMAEYGIDVETLTVQNGASVAGGLTVSGAQSSAGAFTVADTTQSTDKDTGSFITEGGAGIEKNLNVGGALGVVGVTNFASGSVTVPGLAFSADADGTGTGWYRISADRPAFSINGTKAVEYQLGTYDFLKPTAGSAAQLQLKHSDNTNAASHARLTVATGGANGGDPMLYVNNSVVEWYFGIDNSNADKLVLGQGDTPGAADLMTVTPSTRVVDWATVHTFSAGVKNKVYTADVSNPPTNAELESAVGAAATVGAGFTAIIDDNNGHANEYIVWSDGTKYWYAAGTAAP